MKELLLKESKHWDLDISLKELLISNPTCKMDINYRRHSSDDCFGKFLLYFTHPQHTDRPYDIEIGIAEDGFVYVGNGTSNEAKIVPTEDVIPFMIKYGSFVNSLSDFSSELCSIGVSQDCINVIYESNYSLEHKFSRNTTWCK